MHRKQSLLYVALILIVVGVIMGCAQTNVFVEPTVSTSSSEITLQETITINGTGIRESELTITKPVTESPEVLVQGTEDALQLTEAIATPTILSPSTTTPVSENTETLSASSSDIFSATLNPTVIVTATLDELVAYNNQALLFTKKIGADSSALFVTSPDGRSIEQLTPYSSNISQPEWSPDCESILLTSYPDSEERRSGLYILDNDRAMRMILESPEGDDHKWSPDGSKIAFVLSDGHYPNIFVFDTATSNIAQLTDKGMNFSPEWTPDGNILFQSQNGLLDGVTTNLIKPNGADLQELPLFFGQAFSWSPAGSRVAFTRKEIVADPVTLTSLYIMNGDGSNVHRLTDFTPENAYADPLQNVFSPTWSPDGTRIAYIKSTLSYTESAPSGEFSEQICILTLGEGGTNCFFPGEEAGNLTDLDWCQITID